METCDGVEWDGRRGLVLLMLGFEISSSLSFGRVVVASGLRVARARIEGVTLVENFVEGCGERLVADGMVGGLAFV